MAYETLDLGLELTLPTNGTTNWGTRVKDTTWTKISSHDHTGSGNGQPIGTTALSDGAVTTAKLASNFGVTVYTIAPPGGITATVDFANGMIQFLDLGSATGDVTITLSSPEEGGIYRLFVTQAATPRDLIWPASVKWPQGQKLLLSSADNAIDCVTLIHSGGVYYGDWQLDWS